MKLTYRHSAVTVAVALMVAPLLGCSEDSAEKEPSRDASGPGDSSTSEAVTTDAAPPPPSAVTMSDVMAASLPPICGFPAGELVDGEMVTEIENGQPLGIKVVPELIRLGDLDSTDGGGDAAVVLDCEHGGVAWPQVVALMTSGGEVLGHQDLFELTSHGRERVQDLRFEDGAVIVEWYSGIDTASEDFAAFMPGSASAAMRWDGAQVVVEDLEVRGVTSAWQDLRSAIMSGDTDRIEEVVDPSLLALGDLSYLADPVEEESCSEYLAEDGEIAGTCTLTWIDPPGFIALSWTRTAWDTWRLDDLSSSWS